VIDETGKLPNLRDLNGAFSVRKADEDPDDDIPFRR